jgi:arginine-tRNA-protein transferase
MFTEKQFPESLSGGELDDLLAKGWYRMGLSVFTCHFLFFEESLFSPIWLRLPLEGYQFRKSLQKNLLQNRQRFRTVVKHGVIDNEKEALFQKYKLNFKGMLSASILDSLLDGQQRNIFDTFEVSVYDGDKLVAFSYFDLGDKSLASIKGVYDHDYASHSLGIYTMLEEIQFGKDLGFQFYYPGYIVPGFPRFDYKLRIGKTKDVQFFDLRQQQWLPMTEFSNGNVPVGVLSHKLNQMGYALTQAGINAQMLYYPAYEANAFMFENEHLLESPLFLTLFNNVFPRPRFIVYYDLWKDKYVFTHCMPLEDLGLYFEYTMKFDTKEARHFLDYILEKSLIIQATQVDTVVKLAVEISKLIKPPGVQGILK